VLLGRPCFFGGFTPLKHARVSKNPPLNRRGDFKRPWPMAASYHILLLVLALPADAVPSWCGLLRVRGAPLLFEEDVLLKMKANCVFVFARHHAHHRSSIGNISLPPSVSS